MAANNSLDKINLDFASLTADFKEFLRTNNQFKDYDFDGSNTKLLLELLSYNTHKNAFYYNMAISEAFLDSAQKMSSVVSHAKDLNYLPKSRSSAQATVRVTFEATGESAPYLIQKGAPFSTLVKNESYLFTIAENKFVASANNTYTFDATIYEGLFVRDQYQVTDGADGVRYQITNKNVDTSSLQVSVFEDGSTIADIYSYTDTLLGLTNTSKIFFLQAVGNGYYEVLFGDGIFGRKPKVGATIVLEYRVTEGESGNGARSFSVDFDPTGSDELLSTPTIETLNTAADGSEAQTIDSIRLYAPRYFATQQRAVASDDYSSLLLAQFAGKIDDVNVYGGETVEPKMYGTVIIAVKPISGEIVPDFIKSDIQNYLKRFIAIPNRTVLTDPEYFHAEISTTVQYDPNITSKSKNELQGLVFQTISNFSDDNLEKFDRDFRFSRFVKAIDDTDAAIVSNDTTVNISKRFNPTPSQYFTTTIEYNNPTHPGRMILSSPVFTSSAFTYIDPNGVEYPLSYLQDDGFGKIIVYHIVNENKSILNLNIGSIDYNSGKVTINKLLGKDYFTYFKCNVVPRTKDIVMDKAKVLLVDSDDIDVTLIGKLT